MGFSRHFSDGLQHAGARLGAAQTSIYLLGPDER